MKEANRDQADGNKRYNEEDAKASFCEELLSCCTCGKIYFSRNPITLSTLSRKTFHVCAGCSRNLMCSICSRSVRWDNALVVENLDDLRIGLLCPRCREIILSRFQAGPASLAYRMWLRFRLALASALSRIRRINIRALRKK